MLCRNFMEPLMPKVSGASWGSVSNPRC
jgi:hypothetical protein